jgi:hypothetical protein
MALPMYMLCRFNIRFMEMDFTYNLALIFLYGFQLRIKLYKITIFCFVQRFQIMQNVDMESAGLISMADLLSNYAQLMCLNCS